MEIKTFQEVFIFSMKSLFHLAKKTLEPHVFFSVFINSEHLYLEQSNNSTNIPWSSSAQPK